MVDLRAAAGLWEDVTQSRGPDIGKISRIPLAGFGEWLRTAIDSCGIPLSKTLAPVADECLLPPRALIR